MEANEYLPPDMPGHGYTGYVNTTISDPSFMKQNSDVQKLASQLIKVTGGDVERDINAPDPDRDQAVGVFGMASHGDRNGKRAGSNTYLKSTLADPAKFKLKIQLETLVTKVIINRKHGHPTATGVEVLRGRHQYEVRIQKLPLPPFLSVIIKTFSFAAPIFGSYFFHPLEVINQFYVGRSLLQWPGG